MTKAIYSSHIKGACNSWMVIQIGQYVLEVCWFQKLRFGDSAIGKLYNAAVLVTKFCYFFYPDSISQYLRVYFPQLEDYYRNGSTDRLKPPAGVVWVHGVKAASRRDEWAHFYNSNSGSLRERPKGFHGSETPSALLLLVLQFQSTIERLKSRNSGRSKFTTSLAATEKLFYKTRHSLCLRLRVAFYLHYEFSHRVCLNTAVLALFLPDIQFSFLIKFILSKALLF